MANKKKKPSEDHILDPPEPQSRWKKNQPWFLVLLGLVALSCATFRTVLPSDTMLLTTDDSIGQIALRKQALPSGFIGAWRDMELMGRPYVRGINWTNLSMGILTLEAFAKWNHAINLSLASLFLLLFLREKKLSWPACWVGALTAYWLGSNLTLTYAGHLAKFAILVAATLSLWLFSVALRKRSPTWACLAGGAFGDMFVEQPDVALFFAMALAPYFVFSVWQTHRKDVLSWARLLVPLFGVAALFAGHAMWTGYRVSVRDTAQATGQDSSQKWNYATQWSWPPEETIDFIAPGYTGWRTGEPTGPYTGRMGQSPEWKSTQQGFRNFKLENQYLGALPIGLACWALLVAWYRRREQPVTSREVLIWSVLGMGCFLLACGKYLPFYKLIYWLPAVSSVRNPNKFLQPMQVILGIVAAFGMDSLLGTGRKHMTNPLPRGPRIAFVSMSGMLAALFVVWWMGSASSLDGILSKLQADGWSSLSPAIAKTRIHSLGHGGFMLSLLTIVVIVFGLVRKEPSPLVLRGASWLLVSVVTIDVLILSSTYIKPVDAVQFDDNQVTTLLKKRMGLQRLYLTQSSGFYNHWLTFLFPYQGIRTFNVTAAPRLGKDYKAFLDAVGRDPIRMWQLSGVGYILGPADVWSQLNANEATKKAFELQYAYNVAPNDDGSVRVLNASEEQPGRHCLIRFKGPSSRLALIDSWDVIPHQDSLAAVTAPDFVPFSKVVLSEKISNATPPAPTQGGTGIIGKVDVKKYKAGLVKMKVSTPSDAILRFADRFDPNWTATINDKPVPIYPCDNLFMGLHVPAGIHSVELRFKPSNPTLWIQLIGMAICLTAIVRICRSRRAS